MINYFFRKTIPSRTSLAIATHREIRKEILVFSLENKNFMK